MDNVVYEAIKILIIFLSGMAVGMILMTSK